MTNIDDLHVEADVVPVKPHNDLLWDQFLVHLHQPGQSSLVETIRRQLGGANSPLSEYRQCIAPFLDTDNEGKTKEEYRTRLKDLHTGAVAVVKYNYTPPVTLEGYRIPIAKEERTVPRTARCKLSQIRAGYSPLLQSYMARIEPKTVDKCPDWPHYIQHFFLLKKTYNADGPVALDKTSEDGEVPQPSHQQRRCQCRRKI